MKYEIKKSENMPQSKPRRSWPWKDMEVGDEVTIPDQALIGQAQVNCHVYGRLSGKKFTTKTVGGYLKVWRIE